MKGKNKYKVNEDVKKNILTVLKNYGRSSTTKICFLVTGHTNNYAVLKELDSLKKENKILQETETSATYWSLKWNKLNVQFAIE